MKDFIGLGIFAAFVVTLALQLPVLFLLMMSGAFWLWHTQQASIKGYIGEWHVKRTLQTMQQPMFQLQNIYVQHASGTYTQLDHIVVTAGGIFVIETKNYTGVIVGDGTQSEWTQQIGQHEYAFYNPCWQNAGHVRALQQYVERDIPIFSLVVFHDKARLQLINAEEVVSMKQLRARIAQTPVQLDESQMAAIRLQLQPLQKNIWTMWKQARAHREQLNTRPERAQQTACCPQCGGKLVERSGAYGAFLGCRHYPNCTYTKKCEKK